MIYKDQLNRKVVLSRIPTRIVSLVPSQTELLVDLGLSDHIVGVTKFCVHPAIIRNEKVVVGGTKNVNYDKIKKLNPDIILCNKEENTKEIVACLQKEYPVHVSDIFSLPEALDMIKQYGEIFDRQREATVMITRIKSEKASFDTFIGDKPKKRVAYFIWKKPWMAAGKDTFIDYMLKMNEFVNVFGNKSRYPEITEKELILIKNVDLILLSSEPYPFSEKHLKELRNMTNAEVILVDGECFSWHGSRLVNAFSYFKTLH